MLQLFRRNILFNSILLLPYVFIVHGGRFFINYGQQKLDHTWLYDQIISSLGCSEQTLFYLSLILIFIEANLLNNLVNSTKLNSEGQLFTGLVFVILTGFHPMLFALSAVLLANLFFILALRSIISIYLMKNASLSLFNFGFFIALASIFYTPFIWMILLGIPALMIFRGFSLKELLQIMVGFLSVCLLLFFYLYLRNDGDLYYQNQVKEFFHPYLFSMQFGNKGLIAFLLIFSLFLFALIRFNLFQFKLNISLQKSFDFLFWACFISLLSTFFVKINSVSHLLILITPLTVFTSIML
ncbi:MAG: hypothetical protein ABIO44_03950, partial [Saprospiraceae bacterium]